MDMLTCITFETVCLKIYFFTWEFFPPSLILDEVYEAQSRPKVALSVKQFHQGSPNCRERKCVIYFQMEDFFEGGLKFYVQN